MNICVTRSNKFSPSETFLRNQIKGLENYARVFPVYGGYLPEYEENGKLLNTRWYWFLDKLSKNVLKKENNYFGNYGASEYLKKNKIDIVLANYGISGVKLMPICKKLNLPLIVHFHGFDASHKPTLRKYQSDYLDLFNYTKAIITVSHDMAEALIKMGAPAKKVFINVYGVDTDFFAPGYLPKMDSSFIAVARFAPKKSPQTSITAFYKVLQSLPDATLTMVGPKEELYKDCVHLVDKLQISDKVNFSGAKSPQEILPMLQRSTIFIQHSMVAPDGDSEGTPNSVLEASACGLPVVSTLHGGIKDAVIHGKTGFLVEEGDVEGMADYMIRLAEDSLLAKEMGENGRKYMEEEYAMDRQIHRLYEIIENTVTKLNEN